MVFKPVAEWIEKIGNRHACHEGQQYPAQQIESDDKKAKTDQPEAELATRHHGASPLAPVAGWSATKPLGEGDANNVAGRLTAARQQVPASCGRPPRP